MNFYIYPKGFFNAPLSKNYIRSNGFLPANSQTNGSSNGYNSQALDWELIQAIGEIHRENKNKSNQVWSPHFRALSGAIVVKILKACDYRSEEDHIRNYFPVRNLCEVQKSHWTPDHNTIWNYEVMLGEDGLREINDYVLKIV